MWVLIFVISGSFHDAIDKGRRIFGSKRKEVRGGWKKLHNEELRSLCSSPSLIRIIKPKRIRWAGHLALMSKSRIYI
jgi:hypothetical protein